MIPVGVLHEMLDQMGRDQQPVIDAVKEVLRREISALKLHIEQHQGVGAFQEHIARWGIHLAAFERVQDSVRRLECRSGLGSDGMSQASAFVADIITYSQKEEDLPCPKTCVSAHKNF